MSKDVETTVNVLADRVARLEARVGRLGAWADAHEDEKEAAARANAAKPLARVAEEVNKGALMAEVEELKKRLATTQAEYRRVEEERNASWASERTLRNQVCGAEQKAEAAVRDAVETKKQLEDARREVQAHAKDRAEALNKVDSLTRELTDERCRTTALREKSVALESEAARSNLLERDLAKTLVKAQKDWKQIEDLQAALAKARDDGARTVSVYAKQIQDMQAALAEARKGTPGVQDQFRLEKLGRLFDSLFAHEADLTDETWEFWLSLETAGWLRPSRAQRFHSDMVERIQYLENAAGDQRERVRELMQQAAEASEQARLARIAEDTQRVEKEKALDRVQYLEKALANLSTAHEGLLADKEKALADKEHAAGLTPAPRLY